MNERPESDQFPSDQPTQPASQPFPPPFQPLPYQPPSQPFPYPSPAQPMPYPPPYQQLPYPPGPPTQWQAPYPPMPPQIPPKRSHRALWIVLSVVAVVLVVCIAGIAALVAISPKPVSTASNSTPAATTPTTTGVTPTTPPTTGNHKVGETVTYGTDWQVTIHSVSAYQGDPNQFDPTPAAGNTFLVVDATLKNLQGSAQPLSTIIEFELRDTQGNHYDEAFLPSLSIPDGTIPAGSLAHGKWGYEVPTSAHTFTLSFSDDLGTTTVFWDITL